MVDNLAQSVSREFCILFTSSLPNRPASVRKSAGYRTARTARPMHMLPVTAVVPESNRFLPPSLAERESLAAGFCAPKEGGHTQRPYLIGEPLTDNDGG